MGMASFSALAVVFAKSPVWQALALVLTFVLTACVWLLTETQFLALILILVYVGAVMTLFLFVVMMTDLEHSSFKKNLLLWLPVTAVFTGFFLSLIQKYKLFNPPGVVKLSESASFSDTKALGAVLYTDYVYCFELAAAVLLVAIVSSIALAFKGVKKGTKQQSVAKQVRVRKEDRLKIVSLKK
jgi:NADH-quinone oxidoreductase subunit J